jgi:hypothetical protein
LASLREIKKNNANLMDVKNLFKEEKNLERKIERMNEEISSKLKAKQLIQ